MIEQFPIYGLASKILRWLPNFMLRRYYTEQRLADLIYFDFMPRSESALVNLGQAPSVRLNLQVINLSPFEVELDRANLKFCIGGASVSMAILNRQKIKAVELTSLFLEESLPDGHADVVARDAPDARAWLDGRIDFNCAVRPFPKQLRSLQEVQLKIVNAQMRRSDA